MNGIAALLEQGRYLAAQTDAFPSTTETVEVLNHAQEGIEEVAKNPGIIRTWLESVKLRIPGSDRTACVCDRRQDHQVDHKAGAALDESGGNRRGRQAVHDTGDQVFAVCSADFYHYGIVWNCDDISGGGAWIGGGGGGVAVGLALQGSLSNFAGGVLILLLKPFKVGDYIIEHSHNNEGTVTEISIFYTKLLTVDNKLIVIPNGTLSNSSLTNVTNKDRRRVDLVVGIAYEADIRTAKDVIYAVAEKEEARIPEEKPVVYVDNLAASSVDIGLRVWVKTGDYWPARWRMTENIKYALDAKGISIPYQQIDVQIKQ